MLVLTARRGGEIVASEPTVRDRMVARLHARALDRQLAAGASPESSPALALRAQILVRPSARRYLARSLRRLLRAALDPPRRHPVTVSSQQSRTLRAAADELEALIARLLAPGPVAAHGVAKTAVLLGDGAGPLHLNSRHLDLRPAVQAAVNSLDEPLTL